jgi:hypothetical protein
MRDDDGMAFRAGQPSAHHGAPPTQMTSKESLTTRSLQKKIDPLKPAKTSDSWRLSP